ncbi:ABC transporter ATP-binding protein [Acidocella aquatica]|uniref:ABC transporter ATP-binding protein n=1 Tax=Acidocella aquatica TaxID=1922313 RepID=A0ABQ5ZZ66_9PROT|nr:ABC transporter ATP-binding protein [Acidocella aquatica]GLR65511.1 ABC transporter ATP-binding protein [Acidocella aquatica]
MTQAFLELRNIRKNFDSFTAIDGVSLQIPRGEFVTFLGPSGSGKSTTLYVVAGFIEPSAGEVLLNGRSLLGVPPNHRDIGMVFQRYTLFPHLTVAENIAFPLRVRRRPKAEIAAKVDEMLRLVHLSAMRDRKPAQLSGGQQQRVALARALAYDPQILLMDEPLSALDKKLREDLQSEIKRIHAETGVTVIYVTHDQEEALRLSDRIVLFNHGGIEQIGTGEDLYQRPASAFAAGFIGNSNFIDIEVLENRNNIGDVRCPDGSTLSGVPLMGRTQTGKAQIMLRPEHIRLTAEAEGIGGHVTDAAFLGDVMAHTVLTGWGQEIMVRTPRQMFMGPPAGVGDAVRLGFAPADAFLFVPH